MLRSIFDRHDLSRYRRIFVAGDIHGRFDLLAQRLAELGFDPEQDILILLGDLVDRGPLNEEALDWCSRPCVLRVLGNHDWLTYRNAIGCAWGRMNHRKNGGKWFDNVLDPAEQRRWAKTMIDAPFAMEITTPAGHKVGLVHADVPTSDWNDLEAEIENSIRDMNEMRGVAWDSIWGRGRIKAVFDEYNQTGRIDEAAHTVAGVDYVFFGHTIVDTALTVGNCSWIDTGAYKHNNLTVVDVDQWIARFRPALAA